MSDLKSGHLPAMLCLRPRPCQKLGRRSRLFACSVSYTSVGRKTLRRNCPAHLARRPRGKRRRSFNAGSMTLFRAVRRRESSVFSVQPLCPLCLCGRFPCRSITTETQRTQRLHREESQNSGERRSGRIGIDRILRNIGRTLEIQAEECSSMAASKIDGYCPSGGCHNSTLFPSGSITHPNLPKSESSVLSRTSQPSSRSTWSRD